jgi:hypothetical protein
MLARIFTYQKMEKVVKLIINHFFRQDIMHMYRFTTCLNLKFLKATSDIANFKRDTPIQNTAVVLFNQF